MAETIESFVARLQAEGVQAGEQAAKTIREEAERKAEETIAQARQQAEAILADAQRQAKQELAQAKSEMELAARDTVLSLRETLSRALKVIVAHKARGQLSDAEFLKGILHEVVMAYARQDSQGQTDIRVKVAPEMKARLTEWALGEMGRGLAASSGVSVDLKAVLRDAGFEYTVDGSTVEVTTDSVTAALSEIVGPELRKVIVQALADRREQGPA